jgi:two-component system cell cycle sensor histidine kinase/response regulator CckA
VDFVKTPPPLLESAAELRALFEAALDAIVVTDDEGVVADANRAALELFGLQREQLMGQGLAQLAEPGFDFADHWQDFLRAGWARLEFNVVRPGGEKRTVECSARAAFVPGRHFFFLRDVSERRQLEEQVRHAQKMEAIGRLVGGIAHDFNNLLTAVMIYSGLLAGEVAKYPRLRAYADEIQSAGARGSVLVNQLLALGRRQVLEPRLLSLREAIEGMRDFLQRTLGEDIQLLLEPGPGEDTVRVDPTQLHQVVLNLALNARDAMPGGGRLTIGVDRRHIAAGARALVPGDYVRLQVRDTGCGMSPQVRARIFEPFFTTKPRGKGSGLGLPMVYSIVQQSGGTVEVETVPGGGTTVAIFLPLVNAPPERESAPAAEPRRPGRAATILLVEDEELVRKSLAAALVAAGYRVLTAGNANEAMELVRAHDLDLVVTDLVMPGMNGRELAAGIRQLYPALRIILISGYADEPHANLLAGGPWEFLRKPFPPQRLIDKVAMVLPRSA